MNGDNPDITELRPDLSEVTTTKEVNAAQLAAELGVSQVWTDGPRFLAAVDQATLAAKVAAHVADPYFGEPDEDRQLGALRTKAQAVLAGTDTFSAPQVQRILAGLILLATRRRRPS